MPFRSRGRWSCALTASCKRGQAPRFEDHAGVMIADLSGTFLVQSPSTQRRSRCCHTACALSNRHCRHSTMPPERRLANKGRERAIYHRRKAPHGTVELQVDALNDKQGRWDTYHAPPPLLCTCKHDVPWVCGHTETWYSWVMEHRRGQCRVWARQRSNT